MNRRTLGKLAGSAATVAALQQLRGMQVRAQSEPATPSASTTIGMLLYPGFTALDLIGPQFTFAVLPERTTHLYWKNRDTVESDTGVSIQPTATFAEAPDELEILFVPGGLFGTAAAIADPEVLDFVATRGERATYVTAVCTGSLVLGAAGLLHGYRATTHWNWHDLLPLVGAQPVAARVVEDRNRITGGGVTAGLDFGLTLLAHLAGDEYAQAWQLGIEYDPQPPFQSGTPEEAEPPAIAQMTGFFEPYLAETRAALLQSPGYVDG